MISTVEVFKKDHIWHLVCPPINRSEKIDYIDPEEYAKLENQNVEIEGQVTSTIIYLIEDKRGFVEWKA